MNLWQQYQHNKAQKRGMYFTLEGAADLGVSEGELIADSPDTVYLGSQIADILNKLHHLGKVQCIMRNRICVHEKQGVYENLKLWENGGLVLNVGKIDLRLFLSRWQHAFAVENKDGQGKTVRSVQFYDAAGRAVQKVFLREEGRENDWQTLVESFRSDTAPVFQTAENLSAPAVEWDGSRSAEFHAAWQNLKDVHDFGNILKNFKLDRRTAYRHAPQGSCRRLDQSVWQSVLEHIRQSGLEIMIFAGNGGVVQIQTGQVHNVVRARGYLNILDDKEEGFSMHLKDDEIAETWVVRRPVKEGFVTCIEAFDCEGDTAVQIFGRRKEGQTELCGWTALTDALLNQGALPADGIGSADRDANN